MLHIIMTTEVSSRLPGAESPGLLNDHLLHLVVEETISIDSDTGGLSTSPSTLSSDLPVTPKSRLRKAVQEFTQNIDPYSLSYYSG